MRKHQYCLFAGLLVSSMVYAQTPLTSISPLPLNSGMSSNASEFARQAGAIGGTAQACNQNLALFNEHVTDAINTLGQTPQERIAAMKIYQQVFTNAQNYQQQHHTINCGEFIPVFNNMPLLRSDYKQTVLPMLARLQSGTMPFPTTNGSGNLQPVENARPAPSTMTSGKIG